MRAMLSRKGLREFIKLHKSLLNKVGYSYFFFFFLFFSFFSFFPSFLSLLRFWLFGFFFALCMQTEVNQDPKRGVHCTGKRKRL